jgi:hypothetical protein
MQTADGRPLKPPGASSLRAWRPSETPRACAACEEPLPFGSRANKRTHSGACRTRLCRQRKGQASNACVTGTAAAAPRPGHAWDDAPPRAPANAPTPATAWLERMPVPMPTKARARAIRSPSPAQLSLFGPVGPGPAPTPPGGRPQDDADALPQPAQNRDRRRTSPVGCEPRPGPLADATADEGLLLTARQPPRRDPGRHVATGSPLISAMTDAILEAHAKRSGLWSATHGKVPDASEPDTSDGATPRRRRASGRTADVRQLTVVDGTRGNRGAA